MAISYPAIPNFYNPEATMQQTQRGFEAGKDWRDNKNAEAAFGKYLEGLYAQGSQQGQPQTLAALGPQFGAQQAGGVQRAPLSAPMDPATARVDQAFAAQGQGRPELSGNQIAGRFLKTVRDGGVTNPFALAAIASTGKNESGFDPKNAVGTWSDPSQSGQPGTSGGIMSWRGERLAKLQAFAQANGDDPRAPSPETQAKYLLAEDPALIQRLQAARYPQEAQELMNRAWRFAGYDQPGGEAAERMRDAQAYAPQFGAGPSQDALESLSVGQPAPMRQNAPQMAQAAPQGGMQPQSAASILPPREIMAELFKSPGTRPLAIELVKAAQGLSIDANDPMKRLELQIAQEKLRQMLNPQGESFTLGEGQQRFDASGNLLAQGAEKTRPLPAGVQEYEYAKSQGFPGTFQDWEASKKGGMSLTVDPTTGAVSFQQGQNMKPLTEGQSKDTVFATRAEGALPLIDKFGDALTSLPETMAGGVPVVGNYAKSKEFQQAEQAGKEFLQAVLRKDTGAAITAEETSEYGSVYLPRPGDSPELLAQKKVSRQRALDAIKAGMPPQAILAQEKALAKGSGPQPGAVEDGYRFKGGNPGDPANWEPAQ